MAPGGAPAEAVCPVKVEAEAGAAGVAAELAEMAAGAARTNGGETDVTAPTPDFAQYSPLDLAYIGDAVYEIIIRERVVKRMGSRQVNKLHRETIHYVNAAAQSKLILELMPQLTEQEVRIYKRGRNAVSHTTPKNQDVGDYRRATGFEALIGWLYLTEDYARIGELLAGVGEGEEPAK